MDKTLESAMRQLTSTSVAQYLLANTRKRGSGAAKAHWHAELTTAYVSVFRNVWPDRVRQRHEADYQAVHDATAEQLTNRLDEAIGFDLDGYVDDKVQERFFSAFHRIAVEALAALDEGAEPVAEMRREIERDVKAKLRVAFRRALSDLPEIAPREIASILASVHMRDEFFAEGKRLQRERGTEAVAPRVEQECAAGAWSFMRKGVLDALSPPDLPALRERVAELDTALESLLVLTKFELGDNASRQPWKRAIERCDAARRTLKGENNGNG